MAETAEIGIEVFEAGQHEFDVNDGGAVNGLESADPQLVPERACGA